MKDKVVVWSLDSIHSLLSPVYVGTFAECRSFIQECTSKGLYSGRLVIVIPEEDPE